MSLTLRLFDTKTRQLTPLSPLNPPKVTLYTCGPTVYDYAHIGNFTSFIYWDLLVRTIKALGLTPFRVLNLTDVGHLTSDADLGVDKLEKGAKREGKTVWEIADFYIKSFLSDFDSLHLLPPDRLCRATDFIKESIALVDRLTMKGYTYETSDGIYFDTSLFPSYADFARLDLPNLKAGARVACSKEKCHPTDFALWKFIGPDEDHAMRWDYLGRPGYPGWHLECSAIIHATMKEPIDIHTGGIDHIPVHHTNEIAQSTAAFDTPLASLWLHSNFINVDNQKISKSLSNTLTLADLKAKDFDPLDFKLWVLQGHFQSSRNFSLSDLSAARARRLRWRNQIALLLQDPGLETVNLSDQVLAHLANNLSSPLAISLLDTHTPDLDTWRLIDQVFGLNLLPSVTPPQSAELELIKKRTLARAQNDYKTADYLRDLLAKSSLTVLDTPSGPRWQYLK